MITAAEFMRFSPAPGNLRDPYGAAPEQFGDLYLPSGAGPFPLLVLIHGGCWLHAYNLDHLGPLAAAIARAGIAVWSVEYRRVGGSGGGWPGTFLDIASGADHVFELASHYALNLERVAVAGHSAGGQLALWLAASHKGEASELLAAPLRLKIRGVVSLAGLADLEKATTLGACGSVAGRLLGGLPHERRERYALTSPAELLPLGVRQVLLSGALDEIVPAAYVSAYAEAARRAGDEVHLKLLADCGHYELVTPGSSAWPAVLAAVKELLA